MNETHQTPTQNELIKKIKEVNEQNILLQRRYNDINFQLVKTSPLQCRPLKKFSEKNNIDMFQLLVDDDQEEVNENLVQESFKAQGIHVKDVTLQSEKNKNTYYVTCSTEENTCNFEIIFSCKNLDDDEVELVNINIHEPKEPIHFTEFLNTSSKINSIPWVISGLVRYTDMVIKRSQVLKKITKKYRSKLVVEEAPSEGIVVINFLNSAKTQTILELKWAILFDGEDQNFSCGFIINGATFEATRLMEEYSDLFDKILESREISDSLKDNLNLVCGLFFD